MKHSKRSNFAWYLVYATLSFVILSGNPGIYAEGVACPEDLRSLQLRLRRRMLAYSLRL